MTQQLDPKYGFIFPNITIDPEDSRKLATHVRQEAENGRMWALPFGNWNKGAFNGYPDFWYMIHYRRPTLNGETIDVRKQRTFPIRMDPKYIWEWNEDQPHYDIIRKIMAPVEPFYKKLTRCQILFCHKGRDLPLHVDSTVDFVPQHEANRFLGIKYPITEVPMDNGNPIINVDGTTYRYNVGNHLFTINEAQMTHGAMACDHWRGVLFIDGIIDTEYLDAQEKAPIPIVPL